MKMPFSNYRRCIAVTGLYNSGKTVLLTSLINHLKHRSPDFRLANRAEITFFDHLPSPSGEIEFPFEQCRRTLLEDRVFPTKTKTESSYRCRIGRSSARGKYLLQFLDFPGERFADVDMVGRSFDQWSDVVLRDWESSHPASFRKFNSACSQEDIGTAAILAFKHLLAEKLLACEQHIAPSVFNLSKDGATLRGSTVEELLECRPLTGLVEGSQFAPLPAEVRSQRPDVHAVMGDRYRQYRKHLVDPLFSKLQRCDRLVVLIDVQFLLAAGPAALNDNHRMLESMLNQVRPTEAKFKILPAKWSWSGIRKIAFVATKSDQVLRQDRDNLLCLLQDMIWPLIANWEAVECKFFCSSAVVSTVDRESANGDGVGRLYGRPKYDLSQSPPVKFSPRDEVREFEVSRVPKSWPHHWEVGDFVFPEVFPDLPAARFAAPKQSELDKVFDFVTQ